MLDLGVLLSSKIEETTIDGKKVFSVADGYLIDVHKTHAGYFSIDKKGRKADSSLKRAAT